MYNSNSNIINHDTEIGDCKLQYKRKNIEQLGIYETLVTPDFVSIKVDHIRWVLRTMQPCSLLIRQFNTSVCEW